MKRLNLKELIFLLTTLFGWGVTYGILKSDVKAQGEAIKELRPVDKQLAVLTEKVENMDKKLDLLLRNRSRP